MTAEPPPIKSTYPDGAVLMVNHCGAPLPVIDGMIHCQRCGRVYQVPPVALSAVGRLRKPEDHPA